MGHMASAYIDDIYVNEDVMPVTRVREHLARFGPRTIGRCCKQESMVPDAPNIVT